MHPEKRPKRRTPIDKRITIEVDGQPRRLAWIAENRPEFLIQTYAKTFLNNSPAILSALAKAGWKRPRIEREVGEHPEWGVDPGVLGQF